MTLIIPHANKGQQLGETRLAMTKRLMLDLEDVINKHKDKDKFYILVHAKPFPNGLNNLIKIKLIPMNVKPSMMLSCMLFGVDNKSGKLTLEWSLGGDWPVHDVEGEGEPVPETIASLNALGKICNLNDTIFYGQD
jgi:hypothetical protein